MAPPRSIWARKLDLLYLVFFIIHIPIMLTVDLSGYYPPLPFLQAIRDLRTWYIATYRDLYFIKPPVHFHVFLALEAVYHVPLSIWVVPAILRDDPLVPLHLLIWSIETSLTTLVCVVDVLNWPGYSGQEVLALQQLYVPYFVLALGMGIDMFLRTKNIILAKAKTQ